MRHLLPATVLLVLVAAACVPRVSVPEGERQRAARELGGQTRYTKVALFAGPLFGDASKMLVTDQPVQELDLLETADGKVLAPPPPQRVLPPGTRVQVESIEFPTGWLIARRAVMTPRYHPWAYLRLEGEARPLVVVLPQTLATADEVRIELGRYLSAEDPSPAFQALPEAERAAVMRKQPLEGMGARALEMAWGYPEKKVIDRPAGTEDWAWPGGKREASLRDGKVVSWREAR